MNTIPNNDASEVVRLIKYLAWMIVAVTVAFLWTVNTIDGERAKVPPPLLQPIRFEGNRTALLAFWKQGIEPSYGIYNPRGQQ